MKSCLSPHQNQLICVQCVNCQRVIACKYHVFIMCLNVWVSSRPLRQVSSSSSFYILLISVTLQTLTQLIQVKSQSVGTMWTASTVDKLRSKESENSGVKGLTQWYRRCRLQRWTNVWSMNPRNPLTIDTISIIATDSETSGCAKMSFSHISISRLTLIEHFTSEYATMTLIG